MSMLILPRVLVGLLALVGAAAIALTLMLASPVRPPPPLASIHAGAVQIDEAGAPDLSRFQARDGTWLADRLYPVRNGARDQIAILAHGSSASSIEMNAVAKALAEAGVTAVALDIRGHGASGTRGDIAYPGQLDDDLADLIAELRKAYPAARFSLIGHSSGGGFALRIAGSKLGDAFDRFVLLAPYLGYSAPTNRPSEGKGLWAQPDLPRIFATLALQRLGIDWPQSLPAIAFADAPEAKMFVTSQYSFRLMRQLYRAARLEGCVRARQRPHLGRRGRRRRTDGRRRLSPRASAARGCRDGHPGRRSHGDRLPAGGDQGDPGGDGRTWRVRRESPMSRILAAARFALAEFGPLIVFWTLVATLGVKPAILGSILFIVADAAWRWRKGLAFTRLYLLVSSLTLVFGFIDLASTSPFMLKYEAVITNAVTGLAFVAGALGEKPIIQEVAEQRGENFVATQEVRAFFRLFTLVWAAYFFIKTGFYLWAVWTLPMLEAMALRSIVGGVSLAAMIALSTTQGRRLFFLCRRLGLLPKPDPLAAGAGALPAG